jgi:hypothetical protein
MRLINNFFFISLLWAQNNFPSDSHDSRVTNAIHAKQMVNIKVVICNQNIQKFIVCVPSIEAHVLYWMESIFARRAAANPHFPPFIHELQTCLNFINGLQLTSNRAIEWRNFSFFATFWRKKKNFPVNCKEIFIKAHEVYVKLPPYIYKLSNAVTYECLINLCVQALFK